VAGGASRRLDANARIVLTGGSVFWLWVTAVALAVLNTIAKEFVDKQSMSKRARLGWSALIVVVASVGADREQAIASAGWPAHHESMAFFGAPHGLQVRFEGMVQEAVDVPDTDEASCPRCLALSRALVKAGFPAKVIMWPRTNVGEPSSPTIELVSGTNL
jgi:hypothetical protein